MSIQTVDSLQASNRRIGRRSLRGARDWEPWVRPAEWPALPSVSASESKFVGLVAVGQGSGTTYLRLTAVTSSGNYTVDWGDGVTESFASTAFADHAYSYNDSDLTSTTYGYKVAIVVVTGNLTAVDINRSHPSTYTSASTPWLEVVASLPNGSASNAFDIGSSGDTGIPRLLQRVALLNLGPLNTAFDLFANCSSLESVELGSTSNITNMQNMFRGCRNLRRAPVMNTSAVTTMTAMFQDCSSLVYVPSYNCSAVTTMASMFNGCSSLREIPDLSTPLVTSFSAFASGCTALKKGPNLTASAATNVASMFSGCFSLEEIPAYNFSGATSLSSTFNNCYSLLNLPLLNTSAVTNFTSAFSFCRSLRELPALNMSACTTSASTFADSAFSLDSAAIYGMTRTMTVSTCNLSRAALETLFSNLGKAFNASQTITITSNPGADTAISKTSCGTTTGSTIVTQSNTSSLATGMICTGTGISGGVAVTFQDSGDTVTRTAHGLANGTMISFSVITSTTGISTYTNYWVVNATTNTFQVAATQGGAALPLTTDGSGTLLYPAYITAITTNTSVTLSAPASATGTVTLSFRNLDTFKATSKGWAISG